MKRIGSLLMALVLVTLLAGTVRADVIYEPEDTFLQEHYAECQRHDRGYTANGPEGQVTVYKSPESDRVMGRLDNGDSIWVYYLYTDADGNLWGYCENYDDDYEGWVPMAYMSLIYDYVSFEEDYADQFISESGSIGEAYIGQTIYAWKYPGSETCYNCQLGDYTPEYHAVFVDEDGRSWGYIQYYMGLRNCWICLDDPLADFDTLFPNGAPQRWEPAEMVYPEHEIKPGTSGVDAIVIVAVAAVVAVTAVLLWRMKRKKS